VGSINRPHPVAFRTLRELLHPPWDAEEIYRQLYAIGWRSTSLVLVAGVVVGIVIAELIWTALVNFGAVDSVIPAELSRTMFRQMVPGARNPEEALFQASPDGQFFVRVNGVVCCLFPP
jgi:ABC-type transporter Mla maintaining outer membrane lipid asymmetry permease subunit MlaE